MALLGAQLVITLIMVSVIQKVTPHFSFARWILCSTGLRRYLYPTDQQLRNLAGMSKEKPKKFKHTENEKIGDVFYVPRNLDIRLQSVNITPFDIVHLKYYTEYQWLMDFSVYAAAVYIMTEIYNYLYPISDEINLSMLWCSLVVIFAFKVLLSLWVEYFKGDESLGERSTCIITGFAYLVLAMVALIVDENELEIDLDKAYASFNHSASIFLDNQGLPSTGPASKVVVKFFLSLWCGLLGSLFTFPGLRMSRMHLDAVRYNRNRKLLVIIANFSYSLPIVLVGLWVKPVSRDYFTVRIFTGMNEPLMTTSAFETMRLLAIIVTVLLKFILMPIYLQSHLNLAVLRLEKQKKEAGRITNVRLQKRIAEVFYYLCVVALQFIIPIIICLFLTFMYKTLGGYTWEGIIKGPPLEECPVDEPPKSLSKIMNAHDNEKTVAQTAQDFQLALSSLKQIFTVDVYRGLLGLITWWSCFALFASTAIGMFYQTNFYDI